MRSDKGLLLSGGIESTCIAYWMRPKIAYTVNYGQIVAEAEIRASTSVCKFLNIKHIILHGKVGFMKTGDLAGQTQDSQAGNNEFWPFRNQFIITCALMKAYEDKLQEIMIGSVKTDTKFKDGHPDFIRMVNNISKFQDGPSVVAPAMELTSSELILLSRVPKQLLGLTFSCHTSTIPCGQCAGCKKNRALLYK